MKSSRNMTVADAVTRAGTLVLLLPLLLVSAVGCGGGPSPLMPTPNIYARGLAEPFENLPPAAQGPGGLALGTHDVDKGVARYDLTIALYDDPQGLHGWLEVDTALFEEATAYDLAAGFRRLAEAVVARPKVRLDELGGL